MNNNATNAIIKFFIKNKTNRLSYYTTARRDG